jgi:hypothetical protein
MVTTVGADEIVVKQNLVNGNLQIWSSPGVHWQNFGTITRYKKSAQYWFSAKTDEGKTADESIVVRFNDGGHGKISGSLRYMLPLDPQKMIALHSTYGSMAAINHELIRQVVNKSVFMTGPLMSSRESYAERRNDLITYITDQIVNGVYRTEHKQTETVDPITGQKKTVDYVQPKIGTGPNGIEREEESPIQKFGMGANNVTINGIEYDTQIEEQIKKQQEALMAVQQAIVNARKAEQDALTVEQQGKADAAKAKWAQEVVRATEMTTAQKEKDVALLQANKDKEVAALELETAKLAAQTKKTESEAEANARERLAKSDGNIRLRLETLSTIHKAWSDAYSKQRPTPDVQVGSGGEGRTAFMDLLTARLAKEVEK